MWTLLRNRFYVEFKKWTIGNASGSKNNAQKWILIKSNKYLILKPLKNVWKSPPSPSRVQDWWDHEAAKKA